MTEEFAEVHADNGAQHQDALVLVGELVLQVGCAAQSVAAGVLWWCLGQGGFLAPGWQAHVNTVTTPDPMQKSTSCKQGACLSDS